MSKPVKALLRKELVKRLTGLESLAVLSLAGVDGLANNELRRSLRERDIYLTVVKNSIGKQALTEVGLSVACELLEGPCALVYGGGDKVGIVALVRELLDRRKDVPALTVKGALMEREVFGSDRVQELSRYPTRPEALGNLVRSASSPGARLAGAMLGPGGYLAGVVKTVQDRAQEAQAVEN